MALIQCSECGAQVSDLAKNCPQCGVPLKNERTQNRQHSHLYTGSESYQQYTSNHSCHYGPNSYGQAEFSYRPHPKQYCLEYPKLTFGEAIAECFNNYVTFSGRARRSEYWFFYLFNTLINFILWCFLGIFLGDEDGIAIGIIVITAIYRLAVFLPGLSVSVRRLHDIGKSGANLFWSLVPIVGWIMFFCMVSTRFRCT
ncbi:MAG: DUF805 domain-containing protein [Bacteroides sp.]|nr:DUF805 domain-containing protein [Ruminococcus flavefaciens]MCM1554891.1 DUF805 domain-containing protein [Bacteroides sp.]